MKKLLLAFALILFIAAVADCQMVNQNTQFTKVAMFSGKPIVQDTAFLIVNGTDTLKISIHNDSVYFWTNSSGFQFDPPLSGGGGSGWGLTGNAGTEPIVNFIGTTDSTGIMIMADAKDSKEIGITLQSSSQDAVGIYLWGTAIYEPAIFMRGDNVGDAIGIEFLANNSSASNPAFYITGDNNDTTGADIRIHSYNGKLKLTGINEDIGVGGILSLDSFGYAKWTFPNTAPLDSATIYALTPSIGTTHYCTDCTPTDNSSGGCVVTYNGSLWKRNW